MDQTRTGGWVSPRRGVQVKDAVHGIAARHADVHVTRGRKVLELRPRVAWDKGRALLHLLEALGLAGQPDVVPIYIGDDRTDEDAFEVLRGYGIGILVSTVAKATAATFSLSDPDQVRYLSTSRHGETSGVTRTAPQLQVYIFLQSVVRCVAAQALSWSVLPLMLRHWHAGWSVPRAAHSLGHEVRRQWLARQRALRRLGAASVCQQHSSCDRPAASLQRRSSGIRGPC